MKFADVKNDIAFRKIFGNENKKIIIISFLNAVLGLTGDDCIAEIDILNPYQLPIIQNLKASIIDVRAKDKKGNAFIIEMQVANPVGIDKRLLYYASKEYAQQIESGNHYTKLKPVIFIGIFDFELTAHKTYFSHHVLCEVETGERILNDMDFYFIELPKFDLDLHDLTTIIDKWVYFIKEAQNLEIIPDNIDDEGLKEAYLSASKHTWKRVDLDAYDYAAMREGDEIGRVEKAVNDAVGKAVKIAMNEEQTKIAIKLVAMGLSIQEVAEVTGLSSEQIEKI
jgi:predicted transposase/invertase (TIGR01784 family)